MPAPKAVSLSRSAVRPLSPEGGTSAGPGRRTVWRVSSIEPLPLADNRPFAIARKEVPVDRCVGEVSRKRLALGSAKATRCRLVTALSRASSDERRLPRAFEHRPRRSGGGGVPII